MDGDPVEEVTEGDCTVILDRTCFYGEGGGQVGDTGTIYRDGLLLRVYDTKKTDGVYLHMCTVAEGIVKVGDEVTADIDDRRRDAIRRNHSACHLLQAALRTVLGTHVEQAGSFVDDSRVRFDFTHYSAVTDEELRKVEALVNLNILSGNGIVTKVTDPETAKAEGAIALFGEKYGREVRMVKMGNFSTELCGGTHCDNTAKIGLFRIISESSVAAGVRRIEGVTGLGILEMLDEKETAINNTSKALKVQSAADMPAKAAALFSEIAALRKEIDSLNAKVAGNRLSELMAEARDVKGIKLISRDLGSMGMDSARSLCDMIKDKYPSAVAVFAISDGDNFNFVSAAGKDAVAAGAHAGRLVGAVAAVTGGRGGGRPDSASAGGKEKEKTEEALRTAEAVLDGQIK